MYTESIERIFYEDIKEKRKAGSGSFHKKGKGVKHRMNGIKTAYDFMKPKERKKLNGEVQVSNMYETILNRAEFELKDEETQRRMLTRWRELYSNKKIMKEMGFTANATYAKLINTLGIEKKRRMNPVKSKKQELVIVEQKPVQEQPIKLISTGLNLDYNGEYDAEAINKILTKLQLLIDGELNKFLINISISERA